MSRRAYALIDGNSFYCSCERLFSPRLRGRPVIVLSNNDGCAVARTPEAKALGIKMGAPYFQIRDLCQAEGVAVFSSNYTLYGDISRRMNELYHQFAPEVEVYSIDESFLDITGIRDGDRRTYGLEMRAQVYDWIGIPTCVGIGSTKTLAKLANHVAKKTPALGGVCDFTDAAVREELLLGVPAEDLWGVGKASAAKLVGIGISSVGQLRNMAPALARQLLGVVGERIVLELNGEACHALESVPPQRKGIAVTRSFGRSIERFPEMREAVAAYATRAAEKLRQHGVAAVQGHVFMHTNKFNGDPWRHQGSALSFLEATNDTHELVSAAVRAARAAWADGFRYAKAGLVLTELVPIESVQRSLLTGFDRDKQQRLMDALDTLNRRFGRGTLSPAAAGTRRAWQTKFDRRSPRYTTSWDELPTVAC
jgi:DNA polymerase V